MKNIKLRELRKEDAPLMVEWMQDPDVYSKMQYDASNVSIEQAEKFIASAANKNDCLHLAITDKNDEYLGTVSLKNIDRFNRNAEFAIAIRKYAMGKGVSKTALVQILEVAFKELNLNKVYLYVRTDNERAIRFYEKCHLKEEGYFRKHLLINEKFHDLKWYSILKSEYEEWLKSIYD